MTWTRVWSNPAKFGGAQPTIGRTRADLGERGRDWADRSPTMVDLAPNSGERNEIFIDAGQHEAKGNPDLVDIALLPATARYGGTQIWYSSVLALKGFFVCRYF